MTKEKPITVESLASYKSQILNNVLDYWEEAKWLNRLGYPPRAYALSILALEEMAKLTIITFMLFDIFEEQLVSFEEVKKLFTRPIFKNHKYKMRLVYLRLPDYDFQRTLRETSALNKLKERALYTDIFESGLNKPTDFFTQRESSAMIEILENTLQIEAQELDLKKLKDLKKVDASTYFSHFLSLREQYVSTLVKSGTTYNQRYIEFLEDVVQNEELFNTLKETNAFRKKSSS